jgi:hypothetical protein
VQAQQSRRLGGDAVYGDQLLLLADRAKEAERVAAEADQPEYSQRHEAEPGGRSEPQPIAAVTCTEHEKRQHESGGHLDADARHECRCAGAKARDGAGRERERRCERQQDQRVVVRSADGEHEQHGVQPDERHGRAPRVTEAPGGAPDERDRPEARGDGERLERPQPAGEPERRSRVAQEREQRAVG